MKVIIDASEVINTLERIVDDRIFRTACLDSIALISFRVQNNGQNSNGGQIGSYSPKYAKHRSKKGRQSAYIDLTFTGHMMDSLTFDKTGRDEYSIGFLGTEAANKAEWNEARFGDIFALSENEISQVQTGIENNVNAAIG